MKNNYTDEKVIKVEKKILDFIIKEFNKNFKIYKDDNGRKLLSISVCGTIPDGYYSNSKKFNMIYNLISHGYLEHLRDYLRNYNMSLSIDYWSNDKSDTDYVNYEIFWDYQNDVKKENVSVRTLKRDNR